MKMISVRFLSAAIFVSCGVQAGNPSSKTPKTGLATITFLKSQRINKQSMLLHLENIKLQSSAPDSSSLTQTLKPNQSSLELYGDTRDEQLAIVDTQSINVGTYDRMVIALAQNNAVDLYNPDGTQAEISTEQLKDSSFYFEQSIEIKENETTKIIVRVDPDRSVVANSERPEHPVFRPFGEIFHRIPQFYRYEGAAPSEGFTWVCAYGYEVERPEQIAPPPPPIEFKGQMMMPPLPPPPLPGIGIELPKIFATKADIVKDETSICKNAFGKARVDQTNFVFTKLPRGKYSLRLFKSDNAFVDIATDISLPIDQ